MGGMSRGRDDIWGLILLSEAWWTAPCGGRRAADEGRRLAAPPRGLADRPGVPRMLGGIWGCILFKLKEYTPRPPKKNSGGVSIPPPDPSYDQRKGFGPSFGNHPEEYGGFRYEGRWDGGRGMGAGGLWGFGGFRLVGDEGGEGLVVLAPGLGGYCPARGRGRHAGVVVPYGWAREDFINHLGTGSPPEPLRGQADGGGHR